MEQEYGTKVRNKRTESKYGATVQSRSYGILEGRYALWGVLMCSWSILRPKEALV